MIACAQSVDLASVLRVHVWTDEYTAIQVVDSISR